MIIANKKYYFIFYFNLIFQEKIKEEKHFFSLFFMIIVVNLYIVALASFCSLHVIGLEHRLSRTFYRRSDVV